MPIAAHVLTAVSFSMETDRSAEFAPGVRVLADCGDDGERLGTVSACSYDSGAGLTAVTLAMDAGQTLTDRLSGVRHGIAVPLSLLSPPGCFFRDARFAARPVSLAADRCTVLTPSRMAVDVGGALLCLLAQRSIDISQAAAWDGTAAHYAAAANRAGRDFYIYACNDAGSLRLLCSADAVCPAGYTVAASRKVGGFHCLCASVGTIGGHALSGYLAGDILPDSVWDLKFCPVCAPEGMVYVPALAKWVDIYLASVADGRLVSASGGTIADGASSPAFHWYKFSQWLGAAGKRLPTQPEFVAASLGASQGVNIAGSADPGTTGGHVDTAGRRMLSNAGCEDCCGVMWQWGAEAGGSASAASYANAYDGNDSGVAGQHYQAPNRASWGGAWAGGAACGSRSSTWANGPLKLAEYFGARGVADARAVLEDAP